MPEEGLKPKTPQKDAGRITDPFVCVPMATGTCPADTAAAEPEEDPPGLYSILFGFRVSDGSIKANGVVTVFPNITAPASLNFDTIVASWLG